MTARRSSVSLDSLLLLLSSCVIISSSINCEDQPQFLQQPRPSDGVIPIGDRAVFSCSVTQDYKIEKWTVYHLRELSTNVGILLDFLNGLGITVVEISPTESQLIVNATLETNGDKIYCTAFNPFNILEIFTSCEVETFFYGPPSAPTQLKATGNGAGSLRLTWFLEVNETIQTNFTLMATNLNSSGKVTVISYIVEQEFNFTMEVDSSCDVYSFQVMATNKAGISSPSEIISRVIPSIPDLTFVQNSLKYSIAKTAGGILLNVTINVTSTCPEYPVTGYVLVAEDSEGSNITGALTQPTGNDLLLLQIILIEDKTYSISIEANNTIGKSTTSPIQIMTNDVQGVSVCLVEGSTYSIQCIYIAGSDNTSTCSYVLLDEKNETNLSGTIVGPNTIQLELAKTWTLSVFDLQENDDTNSTGVVFITSVSLKSVENCLKEEVKPPVSAELPIIMPIVIVSAVLLLFLVTLLLIIVHRKGFSNRKAKKRLKHQRNADSNGVTTRRLSERNSYTQGIKAKTKVADREENEMYDVLNSTRVSAPQTDIAVFGPDVNSSGVEINKDPVYQVLECNTVDNRGSTSSGGPPQFYDRTSVSGEGLSNPNYQRSVSMSSHTHPIHHESLSIEDPIYLNQRASVSSARSPNCEQSSATSTFPPSLPAGTGPNDPTRMSLTSIDKIPNEEATLGDAEYSTLHREPIYHVLENRRVPPPVPNRKSKEESSLRQSYTNVSTSSLNTHYDEITSAPK